MTTTKQKQKQTNKNRVTYKGNPIRLSGNFSVETLQARRAWHDTFQVLKGKSLQPTIPGKVIIEN